MGKKGRGGGKRGGPSGGGQDQQGPQQQQQPQHQQQGLQQQQPQPSGAGPGGNFPGLGRGSQEFPDLGGGGWGRGRGRGQRGRGGGEGRQDQQYVPQGHPGRGQGGRGGGEGRQDQQYVPQGHPESMGPSGDGFQHGGPRGRGSPRGHDRGRGGPRGRGEGGPFQQVYSPPQQYQQPPPQVPTPPQSVYSDDGSVRSGGTGSSEPRGQPPTQVSKALTPALAQMSVSAGNGKRTLWQIPERKKKCDKNMMVGTRGRKILIEVNHLALNLKKLNVAYHYDCAFKPDVPKKMLSLAMEQMRKECYPQRYPAFDGRKNLYSSGPLPFDREIRRTVLVKDDERDKPKEFDVTVKLVSTVDLSQIQSFLNNGCPFPQDAIQALDIALRNPASIRFTQVGRSFFTRPQQQIISLGNGLELWYGFYQSAILGWKPFLNVDVAHKGFPEPKPLLDIMLDMKAKYLRYNDPPPTLQQLAQQGLQRNELEDFNKFIRGLKVVYMIPNQPNTRRVYKMNGTKQPCKTHRFTLDNGQSITIGEYYEREKRYRLKYPDLPSIHVGNKEVCIPPELCVVVQGQVTNRKLDETQTAAMVRAAAKPADERKRRIMEAMRSAGFNQDPCINEFGISVSDNFEKVPARILDAPSLEYKGSKVRVDKGVWRAKQFLDSTRLDRWVVMTLSSRGRADDLVRFGRTMIEQGRSVGMSIAEPRCEVVASNQNLSRVNGDQLKRIVLPYFEKFKAEQVQLVVVVIPDRPPDSYSKVKLAAEVNVGLLTQCLKEKTMFKMNPATAGNILLKVNAKLNGVNHTVDRSFCPSLMDAPTMLVGADVTHPSPDQTTIPSVAAVAASHDRRAFQYNMIWRLQPPREEIILDLEAIMKQQLMFFYTKTRQKPLKVIFYRDGVSEGQFSQVLEREMSAIRRACTSLQADYQPRVTFLVVQKRHHTRFFPTRREDEDGRNKNVPPGTIVDTMITHNREMDFYLVSHASLQGTSRPTKYHKLWDENDIDEDDLEELTYYLCHLFSRCTRSVSYPAPTYYAHLAAARGRVYLEGSPINLTNLNQEMRTRTIQDVIIKGSPMFFV